MPLSQELRKRFAAHVGAEESATEDAILAAVAGELDARKTDIETLTQAKLDLSRERDDLKKKHDDATLELSSRPAAASTPDPVTLSLVSRLIRTEREQAIAKGAISQAGADAIDGLFMHKGTPTSLALSRAEGDTDPVICRVYEILKTHAGQGIKHGNGVERIEAKRPAGANGNALDLAREQQEEPISDERRKELLALSPFGRDLLANMTK